MSNQPIRAAYVHVPFCKHRCGYCNFTVVAGRDDLIGAYLQAIERELSWLGEPRTVDTLFCGGGTPTHLSPAELSQLFHALRRSFLLADGYEFSVEANPADLTDDRIAVLVEHGVNRISLGAQSLDPTKLTFLDRDHEAAEIERCVSRIRAHVRSVSVDLIFGVPGETLDRWVADLNQIIRIQADHVSTYGLTYERGTALWIRWSKAQLERLDDETERLMFERAIDELTSAGYEHYEVSNFARAGHRCRHNEVYWAGAEYYAVGPGAARYVAGRREVNHRSTTTYLRRVLAGQSPVAESEQLSPEDRAREALVIGLRRIRGVDRKDFANRTGFELQSLVGLELDRFIGQRLLRWDADRLCLTRQGLMVSDSIWPYFLRA
jgi:putative oxygen-independent coproporphyrinogen III oxidase